MLGEANKMRDRKLRRRLLDVAKIGCAFAPNQRISGSMLTAEVHGMSPTDMGFEDEAHKRTLLRELVSLGYLQEFDSRRKRSDGRDLDHLEYGITELGTKLLLGAVQASVLVEDERNLD